MSDHDQNRTPAIALPAALVVVALVVVAIACLLLPLHAAAEEELVIAAGKLPESIRQALGDVDIEGVEQETLNGATTYEIDIEEDGVEFELTLDAKGRLLGVQVEDADDDEEAEGDDDHDEADDDHSHHEHSAAEAKTQVVDFSTLPHAAQMALGKEAGKAAIEEVEREEKHGRVIFEAMWNIGGIKHEASVTSDGVVVNTEKSASAESVPRDVREAAEKALAGNGEISYERKLLVFFEAEAGEGEQKEEMLLSPLGIQVELEEQQD